ncbi:MAG: tRNA lysidine(34) synthetase TilS, partial [Candidatus Muiribacterium halophilum]
MADKDILKKIAKDLIEKKIIKENLKILLGLSGGPDSIFCLYLLLKLKQMIPIEVFCVHVNYNLRGKDSVEDMEFCSNICQTYDIPFFVKDVRIEDKKGIQEKARNIRIDFFDEVMDKHDINFLALAHNRDDNIETILFNIIRGTGINGITGIDDKSILRPILNVEKETILKYLKSNKIVYRDDFSNKKTVYTRNTIRHKIIPEMKEINPSLYNAFENLSLSAKEHRKVAKDNFHNLFEEYRKDSHDKEYFVFDLKLLSEPVERLNIFFEMFFREELKIKEGVYRNALSELLDLKEKSSCKKRELKGYLFFTDYDRFYILKEDRFEKYFPDFNDIKIEKPVDNECIRFETIEEEKVPEDADIYIDLKESDLIFPLVLRHRKNGDRISGKKLLKKIFIDEKINKLFRDRIPVLEDAQGNIIWVPGVYTRKYSKANIRLFYIGRK